MSWAFPTDPKAIANYSDLLTESGLNYILRTIDSSAPAWLFWVSLMLGLYLYYVIAIVGVKIGAKLVPTKEEDALELTLASSPQNTRRTFLENYLAGLLAIFAILIPSYVILIIVSFLNNGSDIIGDIGIVFMFYAVIGIFMMSFTCLFTVLRFNKSSGEKFGFLYLVYSFIIGLSAASPEMTEEILNTSVDYYLTPMDGLLNNQWNWEGFIVVLTLSMLFVLISWWRIKKVEYIERVSPVKIRQLRLIPNYSAKGKLAQKYPLFFDQLRADRGLFYIWSSLVLFFIFYIVYIYETVYGTTPEKLVETIGSFDMPIFKPFTHGHEVRFDYLGFIGFEFYGLMWMYFGLFVLFPAASAASRDYRTNSHDIVWANGITPKQVINRRMLAIQFQFFIFYTLGSWFLLILQWIYDIPGNTETQIYAYLVGIIYFIGLILILQGITMYFKIGQGRKIAIWIYIASILILITSFLIDSLSIFRYLSIFYYFDAVGIAFGDVSLISGILTALTFTIISGIIYVIGLRRFENSNLC